MDRKLIFFDIDGTLISNWREMPQSAAEAVRIAKENGIFAL